MKFYNFFNNEQSDIEDERSIVEISDENDPKTSIPFILCLIAFVLIAFAMLYSSF